MIVTGYEDTEVTPSDTMVVAAVEMDTAVDTRNDVYAVSESVCVGSVPKLAGSDLCSA